MPPFRSIGRPRRVTRSGVADPLCCLPATPTRPGRRGANDTGQSPPNWSSTIRSASASRSPASARPRDTAARASRTTVSRLSATAARPLWCYQQATPYEPLRSTCSTSERPTRSIDRVPAGSRLSKGIRVLHINGLAGSGKRLASIRSLITPTFSGLETDPTSLHLTARVTTSPPPSSEGGAGDEPVQAIRTATQPAGLGQRFGVTRRRLRGHGLQRPQPPGEGVGQDEGPGGGRHRRTRIRWQRISPLTASRAQPLGRLRDPRRRQPFCADVARGMEQAATDADLAVFLCNRTSTTLDLCSVSVDNTSGGRMAIEHLIGGWPPAGRPGRRSGRHRPGATSLGRSRCGLGGRRPRPRRHRHSRLRRHRLRRCRRLSLTSAYGHPKNGVPTRQRCPMDHGCHRRPVPDCGLLTVRVMLAVRPRGREGLGGGR